MTTVIGSSARSGTTCRSAPLRLTRTDIDGGAGVAVTSALLALRDDAPWLPEYVGRGEDARQGGFGTGAVQHAQTSSRR
jgi:hypothetical protein